MNKNPFVYYPEEKYTHLPECPKFSRYGLCTCMPEDRIQLATTLKSTNTNNTLYDFIITEMSNRISNSLTSNYNEAIHKIK